MTVRNVPPVKFSGLRSRCRIMDTLSVSRTAAEMVISQAKTQRGTVLTPGCNTPLIMYQVAAIELKREGLVALMKGEKGDFSMGMIDGVEWPLESPLNFRNYYYERFLRFLDRRPAPSLSRFKNPELIKDQIERAFGEFKNAHVPALSDSRLSDRYCAEFNAWLESRIPIDLVVLGLGPDHVAFLGPGETIDLSESFAKRVELWEDIREWKWQPLSRGSCFCARDAACTDKLQAPDHALTITWRTILSARHILLIAMGGSKAPYVKRLIDGPYDPRNFPQHYLAYSLEKLTILLDEAAAGQI